MNDNNPWHVVGVPFFLEVEYHTEYNKDTESSIMRSLLRNEDLLPGLRVNKMFANCVDKDVLIADELQNDLEHLKDEFTKFAKKYSNFKNDKTIDNCLNKLGMNVDEFSTEEQHHVNEIKEATANNKKPIIDSTTGRYKAYDDPTNFPT